MQKMACTTKTKVLTENGIIQQDGYSSISVTNTGTDDVRINDNIPLIAGSKWAIDNQPFVTMAENTAIRFAGINANKQVLVQMNYYKEI